MLAGVILAAAVFITGLTMAKYVHQWKSDPALAGAKAFYFTSDLLKEADENARYELYSWAMALPLSCRILRMQRDFLKRILHMKYLIL